MGRGRAKAKQTKVARQLKYQSGEMNLDQLRAELATGQPADGEDGVATDNHHSTEPVDFPRD
jgi:hypothetical protein